MSSIPSPLHMNGNANDFTSLNWKYSLQALQDDVNEKICKLRIIDTVFLHPPPFRRPYKWLFTSKNGEVCRKKETNLSLENVLARFAKVSLDNPMNTDGLVALAHTSTGERVFLHQLDLEDIVKTPSTGKYGDINSLQMYIHPKESNMHSKGGGTVGKYINSYELLGDDRAIRKTKTFKSNGESLPSMESVINQQLDSITSTVIEYLQECKSFKIKKISIEYIIDLTDKIWLLLIPELITDKVEANNLIGLDSLVRSDSGGSNNVDISKRPQSREQHSRSSSRGRSLNSAGSLFPSLPTILSPTHQGKDDFFDSLNESSNNLTNGITLATSSPLPAIISNHSKCVGDFCKYNDISTIPGILLLAPDMVVNKQKSNPLTINTTPLHVISNRSIMLARSERRFVMAELDLTNNPLIFGQRWNEIDENLKRDLSSSNPGTYNRQVTVCSNCESVYTTLELLRNRQFRPTMQQENRVPTANSHDSNSNRGHSASSISSQNVFNDGSKPISPVTKAFQKQQVLEMSRLKSPVSTGGTDEDAGMDSARSIINNFDDGENDVKEEEEEDEVYVKSRSNSKSPKKPFTLVSENILEHHHDFEYSIPNNNSPTILNNHINNNNNNNKKKRAEREKKRNHGKNTMKSTKGSKNDESFKITSNRPQIKNNSQEMEKVEGILNSYGSKAFTLKLKGNNNNKQQPQYKENNKNLTVITSVEPAVSPEKRLFNYSFEGNNNNNNNNNNNEINHHPTEYLDNKRNNLIQKHLAHSQAKKDLSISSLQQQLEEKQNEAEESSRQVNKLSEEVNILKNKMLTSNITNESLNQQLKESAKKWGSQQRQWAQAMREKDEDMSKQLLALESRFHAELASRAPSKLSDKSYGPNKELIKSIEEMQRDFDMKQQKWSEERFNLIEKHRQEIIQVKDGFQFAATKPKEAIMRMEDMIQALQAQITEMASDISTSNARAEELKRRLSESEYRKGQLDGEVKLLQQSLTAVTSVGEAGSSESSLLALKSTTSAQIRQLGAEVEFLKAQLASESQCKEEIAYSLAKANEANANTKVEWKKLLEQQDESRKKEIERYEQRLIEEISGPKREVQRLEAIVSEMRQETLDFKGTIALTQAKLEEEKSINQKHQENIDKINEENKIIHEKLTDANEKLLQSQKTVTTESAIKSNLESSVRRLANEVRYSRTQYESEKQCKLELEIAMAECEKRHAEVKAQMLLESDNKVSKLENSISVMNERESILREAQIALQGEVQALSQQLTDTKSVYARSRDQLRADSSALEAAKNTITRLEAEVKTISQDLLSQKRNAGEGSARNEQALIAYQKSMREVTIAKDNEIKSLENNLKDKLEKISNLQKQIIDISNSKDDILNKSKRETGATQLAYCLDRWVRVRQSQALRVWGKTLVNEKEKQFYIEQNKVEMAAFKAKVVSDKDKTCKLLLSEFRENKAAAIIEIKNREEKIRDESFSMAGEDKLATIIRNEEKIKQKINNINLSFEKEKNIIIENLNKSKNVALQETASRLRIELSNNMKESERSHSIAIQMTEKALRADKENALKSLREEMEERIETIRKECKEEVNASGEKEYARLQAQINATKVAAEESVKQAEKAVEEKYNKEMQGMKSIYDKKLEKEKASLLESFEKSKVDAIALVHAEKNEALARMSSENLLSLQDTLKKYNEEKEGVIKIKDIEREKAIEQVLKQSREERESSLSRLHEALQAEAAAKVQMSEKLKHLKETLEKELETTTKKYEQTITQLKEKSNLELQKAVEECSAKAVKEKEEELEKQLNNFKIEKKNYIKESENLSAEALNKLNDHHQKVLETSLMAAKNEMKALAQRLTKEKDVSIEAFVDAARSDRENELNKQKEEMMLLLQDHLAEANAIKEAEIREIKKNHEKMKEELMQQAELIQASSVMEAVSDVEKAAKERLDKMLEEAANEKAIALQNCVKAMQAEADASNEELTRESEKMIKALEQRIIDMAGSNKVLAQKTFTLEKTIEEKDDTNYDLKKNLENNKKMVGSMRIKNAIAAMSLVKAIKKVKDEKDNYWKAKVQEIEEDHETDQEALRLKLNTHEEQLQDVITMKEEIHDLLVNYKRDRMMEHKIQNTVIQSDLAMLSKEKEDAESNVSLLQKEIDKLEGAVRFIEQEMREISKISAIQDGRVNIAHAKKKKRLDGEYEASIEQLTEKREEFSKVEQKLAEIENSFNSKQEEMKKLETELVEMLVDQQKQLLKVLSNHGGNNKKKEKEKKEKK